MVPHTVTHLDLHRQMISQLKEDICAQKPQLIEILFNENIIDHIEYGSFSSCQQLTTLQLNRNRLSNLENRVFRMLKNLKNLDLSNNQILYVAPDAFDGLNDVERIDLRDNRITMISDSAFDRLQNIRYIYLENNQIKTIDPSWILRITHDTSNHLSRIFIKDNPITCDCNIQKLGVYVRPSGSLHDILEADEVSCMWPQEHHGKSLSTLNYDSLTCVESESLPSSSGSNGGLHFLTFLIGGVAFAGGYYAFQKYRRRLIPTPTQYIGGANQSPDNAPLLTREAYG